MSESTSNTAPDPQPRDAQAALPALMPRRSFLRNMTAGAGALALPGVFIPRAIAGEAAATARGRVFLDRTGSGRAGGDNPGLGGIAVSNGQGVTLTDEQGRWELPVLANSPFTDFFVIPPTGHTPRLTPDFLRRAHFTHQPGGSPQQRFAGIPPTGPLPASIDFALVEAEQPDRFDVLVCGDPQPRDLREVDFLARTVPQDLAREERAAFAVSLGDNVFDDLAIYPQLRGALAAAGLPWHYVVGNHDLNFDAPGHTHSRETFRRQFGPATYAFDHGGVHFIVLDNVEWMGAEPENPGSTRNYRGMIQPRDLEFVAADLKHVPEDRLVVVFMHIPLTNDLQEGDRQQTLNRQKLYDLLGGRRRSLSFSAHTHWHHHIILAPGDDGWAGENAHHHVISGTLCGSWFTGAPEADGVPHSIMSDGTPRGYQRLGFNGGDYKIDGYQTLGAPAARQMRVIAPSEVAASALAATPVHVNLFSAGPRAAVRARIAGGGDAWRDLQRVRVPDPHRAALRQRDANLESPWRSLGGTIDCPHLWKLDLPSNLAPGTHVIEVLAEDGFGITRREIHPIRVV